MDYRVGIDIGGTFTDFVLVQGDRSVFYKNLTTPEDRALGVMSGLSRLADMEGRTLEAFLTQCEAVVHATTVADNTLIEMNGAVTGLITTEGFRDEMEYRRGFKEDIWDVRLEPPPQIVPRRRRLPVHERILADGSVHKFLDETSVRDACRRLALQNVESVAVSLLFSFVNPAHERRVAEIIREELPGAQLSISHEILPRAPEYDRTSTTVVNAYIAPRVTAYLDRLISGLRDAGYKHQLMIMQASGGVITARYIENAPIRVLASGPAAGVIGSAHVGAAKGCRNLLCVDMGGTSYDMSLVQNGEAPAEAGWNMHHRYLVGVPMIKVETLGAGGGSICHVTNHALQVGPASAGSSPGPICYGRGGTQPTVTDALLMLGILSTDAGFAGGDFALDSQSVEGAFATLGAQIGKRAEDTAFDCWRIVNANMTNGVRRTTAGKGIDPSELVMLAYGGNGPAFAAIQAEELGIKRVLIPKASAAFSALGTLVADPSIDEERAYVAAADKLNADKLKSLWTELADRARANFSDAGLEREEIKARYQVNVRYPGQNFALTFDVHVAAGLEDLSFVGDNLSGRIISAFNARHLSEYGHVRENEIPEVTGVRLATYVSTPKPQARDGSAGAARHATPNRSRRANLGQGFGPTNIYRGPDLQPGDTMVGPAIVEEDFTTIVVYPGWTGIVDGAGDYELRQEGRLLF